MKSDHNLRMLYAIQFFSSLIPAYVIERLFWEDRGMTIQMVVYAEMIYAVTIVLCEVPMGMLADRWGRKPMMIVFAAFGCLEFAILTQANGFWHFAVVMVLAAIGNAAGSGTENALLYETLAMQGRTSSFERVLGRINATGFGTAMLAALGGSWLASQYDLVITYWISLGSAGIALLLSFLLKEPKRTEAESQNEKNLPFKSMVFASLLFFRRHPSVCLVLFSGMVTGVSLVYLYEFWQLYVERLGTPLMFFGAISATMMLLQLPGNLLAHRLLARYGYRSVIAVILAVLAVCFTLAAVNQDGVGLVALIGVALFVGVMEPLVSGYLHHRIETSRMRATLDSFQSLGLNGLGMAAGLGFGFFSARFDVFGGYGFIAFLCGLVFFVFVFYSRKLVELNH